MHLGCSYGVLRLDYHPQFNGDGPSSASTSDVMTRNKLVAQLCLRAVGDSSYGEICDSHRLSPVTVSAGTVVSSRMQHFEQSEISSPNLHVLVLPGKIRNIDALKEEM
ncbi:hypothetical protein J6590_085303 [Homalodisca vitripennis]|nr:hypothetical protein J6590_085303 [Homalodisca vitripennis]